MKSTSASERFRIWWGTPGGHLDAFGGAEGVFHACDLEGGLAGEHEDELPRAFVAVSRVARGGGHVFRGDAVVVAAQEVPAVATVARSVMLCVRAGDGHGGPHGMRPLETSDGSGTVVAWPRR